MGGALVLAIFSLVFAAAVALLARRQRLTLRYTLGWFTVAVLIGASAVLTDLAEPLSDALGIRATELVLGVALGVLLLIAVQISITASGLTEGLRTVCEAQALVEERVRRLESPAAPQGDDHA